MPEQTPTRPAAKALSRPLIWAGVAAVVIVGAPALLYTQRGPIGTKLAVDYLKARGVPAVIRIDRLGPGGFEGAMVLGPTNDPDLAIERVVVEFEPFPLFRDGVVGPRIKSVSLVRPRLKATYARGKVTFGTMQGVIEEFLAQPAVGPPPSVAIQDGTAKLSTPAGLVTITGGGSMPRGRIAVLEARMGAHRLSADGRSLDLTGANLSLRGVGDRLVGRLEATVPRLSQAGAAVDDAVLRAAIDLPMGAAAPVGFDGRFGVDVNLDARRIAAEQSQIASPQLTFVVGGAMRGPLERLTISGLASLQAQAASAQGALSGRALRLNLSARDLHLARSGTGARFDARLDLKGSALGLAAAGADIRAASLSGETGELRGEWTGRTLSLQAAPTLTLAADQAVVGGGQARGLQAVLASDGFSLTTGRGWQAAGPLSTRINLQTAGAGDLVLSRLVLDGAGEADIGARGLNLRWRGALRGGPGAQPAQARAAGRSLAALIGDETTATRLIQTLRLDAPDLRVDAGGGVIRLDLAAPLNLKGEGGGVSVASSGALAIIDGRGFRGGATVKVSGEALPDAALSLTDYRLDARGFAGDLAVEAPNFDAAGLKGAKLSAKGRLRSGSEGIGFYAGSCVLVAADRFEGDDGPVATAIAARLCPTGGAPLAAVGGGGWRARTKFESVTARVSAAEAVLTDAAGQIELTGGPRGLGSGRLILDKAVVSDRAAETRFQPVSLNGGARLIGAGWTGAFSIDDAAQGRALGRIEVKHSMTTGAGEAVIDAAGLAFAKDGLQPAHISPIAALVMTDAEGPANFTGKIAWASGGLTSSGRLTTSDLSFRSWVGMVKGLRGEMIFTGLAPLTTPPDQTFTIERIDAVIPMEKASVALSLTPLEMKLTKAEVVVAKGKAVLDPLELKLGEVLPTSGTLRLTDIDTQSLLAPFNIADKLELQARIDGVVPFAFTKEGFRITDGKIAADGPGRLSIKREALTGVASAPADGAVPAQPNAMQSFAYQAMENLAFDLMDASIGSRPGGRLGVQFHIRGRNDPPAQAEARVAIADLLAGTAFNKDIPLPSGTPVNLTLDTSLNFDELMDAYSQAWRSSPVQR